MDFPNHDTPSGSSKIRVIFGKGLWVLDMVATWVNY
jgi:hypothetical protein